MRRDRRVVRVEYGKAERTPAAGEGGGGGFAPLPARVTGRRAGIGMRAAASDTVSEFAECLERGASLGPPLTAAGPSSPAPGLPSLQKSQSEASEEFQQVGDRIDNHKESQDQPQWQTAFADKETQKDQSGQEFTTCRKIIYPGLDFVSIRQRLSKYYSRGRCSNII
ncbi:unnamed protein product [Gulo gulo]|uniref:Uncharacterized protein n=1 Tax=Gulo gulo TaxID=48420 RepID=A0A9X9MCK6_GULGU|nr:unnamed protein product [Gulo gulo]